MSVTRVAIENYQPLTRPSAILTVSKALDQSNPEEDRFRLMLLLWMPAPRMMVPRGAATRSHRAAVPLAAPRRQGWQPKAADGPQLVRWSWCGLQVPGPPGPPLAVRLTRTARRGKCYRQWFPQDLLQEALALAIAAPARGPRALSGTQRALRPPDSRSGQSAGAPGGPSPSPGAFAPANSSNPYPSRFNFDRDPHMRPASRGS